MLNVTNHEGNENAKKSAMRHQLTRIRRATMGRKRREKGVGKDVVKLEPCTLTVGLYNGASQRTNIL